MKKKELCRLAEQLLPVYVGILVGAILFDSLPTSTAWMLGYAALLAVVATISAWATRQREQILQRDTIVEVALVDAESRRQGGPVS